MRRFTIALTLLTTLLTAPAIAQQPGPFRDITVDEMRGERRVALVIGNGAYADAPLRNPVKQRWQAGDTVTVVRESTEKVKRALLS